MNQRSKRFHKFGLMTALFAIGTATLACSAKDSDSQKQLYTHLEPVSGAIFTTTEDGSFVNANIYPDRASVYLDGGPGVRAPISAAGLPEGDYFFQVTDPSGHDLLSTDHISCRRVHVSENGVISMVYEGTNYQRSRGSFMPIACEHATGVDQDHDAITVQLMPYDRTPNRGGVYKVWMTPVDAFMGNAQFIPMHPSDSISGESWSQNDVHGFVPRFSKTDNFKVHERGPERPPSEIIVKKFHDENADGYMGAEEVFIEGWEVLFVDEVGSSNQLFTSAQVLVTAGSFSFIEATPAGTMQTVSLLDGNILSKVPDTDPRVDVWVLEDSGENHEVIFGNIALGSIEACKAFDRNANGIREDGEILLSGWPMVLSGTDVHGMEIERRYALTGDNGCTRFDDLLPGQYMVTEGSGGAAWVPTGETNLSFDVTSRLEGGSTLVADTHTATFTNVCTHTADFGTKGYWHNKNGLAEIGVDMIQYVNSLLPYGMPSSYFDAGSEPFDGMFEEGTPVAAIPGAATGMLGAEGSALAEISHFLIGSNAGGDAREQLAQQLLAFLMNAHYRLGSLEAMIVLDGELVTASSLIHGAITAWAGTDRTTQTAVKDILDGLNNEDAVEFVPEMPCTITPELMHED